MKVKRLLFIGSKTLGLRALRRIAAILESPESLELGVATIDDSHDGARSEHQSIRDLCEESGFPLFIVEKPSLLSEVIEEFKPDLALVVGWYWLLKPAVLQKVPQGVVGFHASLLPRYRGGAPLVWALINGDHETGVSLFYLSEGMDEGDLVAQVPFTIGPDQNIQDVLGLADQAIQQLLQENLVLLLEGRAPRRPQDHSLATYCSLRTPEDGRLDLGLSASTLHDFIRAQSYPYPGAFCLDSEGRKITVWSATPFPRPFWGPKGRIALVNDEGVVVCCGAGALTIQEISIDGEPVPDLKEILKFGQTLR